MLCAFTSSTTTFTSDLKLLFTPVPSNLITGAVLSIVNVTSVLLYALSITSIVYVPSSANVISFSFTVIHLSLFFLYLILWTSASSIVAFTSVLKLLFTPVPSNFITGAVLSIVNVTSALLYAWSITSIVYVPSSVNVNSSSFTVIHLSLSFLYFMLCAFTSSTTTFTSDLKLLFTPVPSNVITGAVLSIVNVTSVLLYAKSITSIVYVPSSVNVNFFSLTVIHPPSSFLYLMLWAFASSIIAFTSVLKLLFTPVPSNVITGAVLSIVKFICSDLFPALSDITTS